MYAVRSKKKKTGLSPAEQHLAINSLTAKALSHFEDAILDLDEAAAQHASHADALDDHIRELVAVRQKSERDAESAATVADKIRSLVSA